MISSYSSSLSPLTLSQSPKRACSSALGLGQGVIGGIPDEQVPKAVRIASGQQRPIGADQVLAHQRKQIAPAPRWPAGTSSASAACSNDLPITLARSARLRSPGGSWSSRAASSADGGRHLYRGQRAARVPGAIVGQGQVALVDQHAQHLLHEQGLPSAASRMRARSGSGRAVPPGRCAISWAANSAASGSSRRLVAWVGHCPSPAVGRAARAAPTYKQEGGVVRQADDGLEQVEEGLVCPLYVVELDHQRALACQRLEQLAGRPGDLLGRGRASGQSDRQADPLGHQVDVCGIGRHQAQLRHGHRGRRPMAAAMRTTSASGQ